MTIDLRLVSDVPKARAGQRLGPLAERLTAVRKMRGLSLNVAAEVTGLCRQTIKEAETTDRRLRGGTLAKVARGYQVDVDLLDPDVALPAELPAWKSAKKSRTSSAAAATQLDRPSTTFPGEWAISGYEEWRAFTRHTHERVSRVCESIAAQISDREGELVELRTVLVSRQHERAALERALV